jgi:hypothetical protein
MDMTIAIVVVLLLAAGYYYQYNTTCPLTGGTAVVGASFCDKLDNVANPSSSAPMSGLGNADSSAACAALCGKSTSCNAYRWNMNNKTCSGANYPTAIDMNSSMGVETGNKYTSGAKLVSRASPW